MKFSAVTTCNADGWESTGRRMAKSFVKQWSPMVELTVYAEGFKPDVEGIKVGALPEWLSAFKARHEDNPDAHGVDPRGATTVEYNYRRDCVRFAHKVAAITDASRSAEGILLWLDADTFTHAEVDTVWLHSLFPRGYVAWLNRRNSYPECGFLMFRTDLPGHAEVMRRLETFYSSDEVFGLPETHDSFVIQHIIEQAVAEKLIPPAWPLSRPGFDKGHAFIHSELSTRLDHAKGKRKAEGRTPATERKIRDGVSYWSEA